MVAYADPHHFLAIGSPMRIYIQIASDRLEEAQEEKLRKNLPELQKALQTYVDANQAGKAEIINDCEAEFPEDWQLGLMQTVKKDNQLKFPVKLFNDLAKKYSIDCEIGAIRAGGIREAVSFFGHEEGQGDAFMIAQYLEL